MFETAVVHARSGDRRFGFLSLSLAVHTAAVAAVIAASVASTTLPIEAPKQMMPVYLAIPPALGTPDAAPRPKPRTSAVAAPLVVTAPSTIPSTLAPAAPAATEVTGSGTADTAVGVPWVATRASGPMRRRHRMLRGRWSSKAMSRRRSSSTASSLSIPV